MTDQEINAAIAEACGYKRCENNYKFFARPMPVGTPIHSVESEIMSEVKIHTRI